MTETKEIKFYDFISEEKIMCVEGALSATEVIKLLVDRMATENEELDGALALESVLEREKVAPTVIAPGLALPHARMQGLQRLYAAVAISESGLDFGSDEGPVNIVIGILTPKDDPSYYLKVVAAVSRILANDDFRRRVARSRTPEEAFKILGSKGDSLPDYLLSTNIMSQDFLTLKEADTLDSAISMMCSHGIMDCPVIDEEGDVRGVISLEDIMRLSLPEHLLWMDDLSSIINFQPFAELLRSDTETKLADFMREDYCQVAPDTPAIQVAKLFLQEGLRQILVVERRHLRGVININEFISKLFWE